MWPHAQNLEWARHALLDVISYSNTERFDLNEIHRHNELTPIGPRMNRKTSITTLATGVFETWWKATTLITFQHSLSNPLWRGVTRQKGGTDTEHISSSVYTHIWFTFMSSPGNPSILLGGFPNIFFKKLPHPLLLSAAVGLFRTNPLSLSLSLPSASISGYLCPCMHAGMHHIWCMYYFQCMYIFNMHVCIRYTELYS